MIYSVYGNTIENLRKKTTFNVTLVNNEIGNLKHVSKLGFISQRFLRRTLLLFIRWNQFQHLTNQFILDILFLN